MADERVYTERELKEMADRPLAADRPEQAEKPGGKRKSGKTKETEESPSKTPEEQLNELLEKGRKAGKLTAKDLECLGEMNLDSEVLDKFYETLEANGVDIDLAAADLLPPIDDVLPEVEELAAIEEVTQEEINDTDALADSFSTDDPVRMYLKEIGKVPLLSRSGQSLRDYIGKIRERRDEAGQADDLRALANRYREKKGYEG